MNIRLAGCALAATLLCAVAADGATITGMRVIELQGKRQLVLELTGTGPRPQLLTTVRDKAWVAELRDTQLKLGANPDGNYRLEHPAPGLDLIEATQVDAETVRVRLVGPQAAPGVIPGEATATRLVFDLSRTDGSSLITSVNSRSGNNPDSNANGEAPRRFAVRASAPPTGDIAVGEITVGKPIDLGNKDRVTLVLKNAPVREVLQILSRRAGYNILFSSDVGDQRVSMDIQNEALEDTFNFVLRLNGLKGRRIGKTLLVGTNIAQDLLQTQIRTFRLNQADVAQVSNVLRSLGASGGASGAGAAAGGGAPSVGAVPGGGGSGGQGPLQGELFVTTDARTNSLTAIGTPRALQIAQAQIAQLDVRQRQVMIDVKLVDINLNNVTDLGIRIGGSAGNFTLGALSGNNFGGTSGITNSATTSLVGPSAQGTISNTSSSGGTFIFNTLNSLANAIAFRIDAAIQEGSAKVLAAPKLVLQSGESITKSNKAKVDITDDVIVGTTISVDPATGLTTTTVKIDKVGVILNIEVFNIDDNGFVNVSLRPEVSSVNSQTNDANGNIITLLTRRNLDIARLRLRDGQTFVIGGVIREIDRNLIQKIPILGDLPIIGQLFRTTSNNTERREVALMVTPRILRDPDEDVQTGVDLPSPPVGTSFSPPMQKP